MHRIAVLLFLAPLASLLTVATASAEEDLAALRLEIEDLRRQADSLEAQRELLFKKEVESYLNYTQHELQAQGGDGIPGVSLKADVVSTALATLGAKPGNTHAVHGVARLQFDMEVNDRISMFFRMTANAPGGGFPAQFGPIAGTAGATMSGLADGIGVDGTVSAAPGSIRMEEAAVRYEVSVSDQAVQLMAGLLDPRNYYAQNAFAGDPRTQFLNNLFDDPPALNWPTNATGPIVYGLEIAFSFGPSKQYTLNTGWYNTAGQWFSSGLWLWQFTWNHKLQNRPMTLRVYGQLDAAVDSHSAAIGVSWDWKATDKIGVFVRGTLKDNQSPAKGEVNQIESDISGGAVFFNMVPRRPDDTFGIAIGHIKGPITPMIGVPTNGNSEIPIELYYTFVQEDGKLQITGTFQYIIDPGGGNFTDQDKLVLLGVRIYVPF